MLLCSYRLAPHGEALRALSSGPRAAVVPNAGDQWPVSPERRDREISELITAGFDASILDLRDYFGEPDQLGAEVAGLDLVWVPGGNTFVLARAMAASGFGDAACERIRAGSLTYAGYSAGACVAGADLRGIDAMDDPHVIPPGYDPSWPTDTLGLLPWRIVPHWRSVHPETDVADAAVEQLLAAHVPFQTLQDGQALLVNNDRTCVI